MAIFNGLKITLRDLVMRINCRICLAQDLKFHPEALKNFIEHVMACIFLGIHFFFAFTGRSASVVEIA